MGGRDGTNESETSRIASEYGYQRQMERSECALNYNTVLLWNRVFDYHGHVVMFHTADVSGNFGIDLYVQIALNCVSITFFVHIACNIMQRVNKIEAKSKIIMK